MVILQEQIGAVVRPGLTEILIILGIALLLFGAGRLADIGKGLGEGIRNFKKGLRDDDEEGDKELPEGKGATEKAVADLRQAISVDPTVRFQAVNDPDFERIREEPAFIDIIEPTPTGA